MKLYSLLVLFLSIQVLLPSGVYANFNEGFSAATCYSGSNPNGDVAGIIDTSNTPGAPNSPNNWSPPMPYHWTKQQMSNNEVFGIAIDDSKILNPNIYLTSTSSYSRYPVGSGTVRVSSDPTVCVV